jgi:L-lysine 6-transaminase
MLILPCGTHTVRFRPALNVPASDIAEGMRISREAASEAFK